MLLQHHVTILPGHSCIGFPGHQHEQLAPRNPSEGQEGGDEQSSKSQKYNNYIVKCIIMLVI